MSSSSWYRRSLWHYKGNREYTKQGYITAKENFNAEDLDVDCSDRHYVITGCNSGIGLEIAREVAKRGGVLHMVCRNFESAKKARAELITDTGNDKIHLYTLDLAKLREVADWAKEFAATHEKIHVLINNAGCMVHERKLNEDGIETNFAVNTLAMHLITTALLPVLQKNEDARVVTVSSAGMLTVRLDPNDLMHENMDPFNGTLVYSQNKRQQVVMTLWYAQRYDKVHFSVMHPGWADTPAVRSSLPLFYEQMKDNLRTAAEGADTAVWLAISKAAIKFPSGFFFQDRAPASTHLPLAWTKTSIEEENLLMQKLLVLTQKITGETASSEEKLTTENSLNNSNGLANGSNHNGVSATSSSKVEELSATLSAVSVSGSTEPGFLKNDDDVWNTKPDELFIGDVKVSSETENHLPKEESQSKDEVDIPKQDIVPQLSPVVAKVETQHGIETGKIQNPSSPEPLSMEPHDEPLKMELHKDPVTKDNVRVNTETPPNEDLPKQDSAPQLSPVEAETEIKNPKSPEPHEEAITKENVPASTEISSNEDVSPSEEKAEKVIAMESVTS